MCDIYTTASLSPLRKIIAGRMSETASTVPHFRLVSEYDVGRLLSYREARNRGCAIKPSLNDYIIKTCALALRETPDLNVCFENGELRKYRHADISIVVDVDGGLLTPVVRKADEKRLLDIAHETRSLITRARQNKLKMDEIVGGSFSISNLGPFGVEQFDAIINVPQCAILAVGCCHAKMRVKDGTTPEIAQVVRCTLSADHRVIDGATAAKFMKATGALFASPELIGDD